jgi:hypothetical protein
VAGKTQAGLGLSLRLQLRRQRQPRDCQNASVRHWMIPTIVTPHERGLSIREAPIRKVSEAPNRNARDRGGKRVGGPDISVRPCFIRFCTYAGLHLSTTDTLIRCIGSV